VSEENEEAKANSRATGIPDTAALAIDLAMEDARARIDRGGDGR